MDYESESDTLPTEPPRHPLNMDKESSNYSHHLRFVVFSHHTAHDEEDDEKEHDYDDDGKQQEDDEKLFAP